MSQVYDVKCLMCAAEIGHLVHGRFVLNERCQGPLPRIGGLPRCCHCGGSLYLDPVDSQAAVLRLTRLASMLTTAV